MLLLGFILAILSEKLLPRQATGIASKPRPPGGFALVGDGAAPGPQRQPVPAAFGVLGAVVGGVRPEGAAGQVSVQEAVLEHPDAGWIGEARTDAGTVQQLHQWPGGVGVPGAEAHLVPERQLEGAQQRVVPLQQLPDHLTSRANFPPDP